MTEEFYIGQIFNGPYPPAAAIWCNANNAYIEDLGNRCYEIKAVPEQPAPTHEEIRQMRARAYQEEKDPITCHIQSLRDKEQTEEVVAEIAELLQERDEVVEAIKERYPYPDEEVIEEPVEE